MSSSASTSGPADRCLNASDGSPGQARWLGWTLSGYTVTTHSVRPHDEYDYDCDGPQYGEPTPVSYSD
jgi:hypothetical protein